MRLLKTDRYQLFEARDIPDPFPEYAILSHTWISPQDEITYQDFKTRKGDDENGVFKRKGWAKLKRYCDRAAKDGWAWAWMDTCCIDKTSTADTQEAIHAMFRWYQDAGICYVYLEDVDVHRALGHRGRGNDDDRDEQEKKNPMGVFDHGLDLGPLDLDEIVGRGNIADPNSFAHKALRHSVVDAKWFTRGWTLQELLAPHYLVFLDQDWRRIGTRENWAAEIMEASGIEARYLTSFDPTEFTSCSIAMRLSWASRRETTLEEDEAYSLLGLFGISLPLLYGEGRWRAFNRLQRELITYYSDDSIFAWTLAEQGSGDNFLPSRPPSSPLQGYNNSGWGILAPSIREFWGAPNIRAIGHHDSSFVMTNRGLEVTGKRWRCRNNPSLFYIRLSCGSQIRRHVVIYLIHVGDCYERIHTNRSFYTDEVRDEEWEEMPKEPILVRASKHSSNPSVGASIFVLDYPKEKISIRNKYSVDFDISKFSTPIKLIDDNEPPFLRELKHNELFVAKPNHLIFINIEVHHSTSNVRSKLDVAIHIAENGFPTVGILARTGPLWERLGDPLAEASRTYKALASHLRDSMLYKPLYSVVAEERGERVFVGVHLLPRPRTLFDSLPGRNSVLREYVIKLCVDKSSDGDGSGQHGRKRRRIT